MLIRIGAYTKGTDKELDEAIDKKAVMERFIAQGSKFQISFKEASEGLIEIMK
jgi:flagellum-specific ATP synthase